MAAEVDTENIPARQLPAPGSLNIDHIAHFVPDIEAASLALAELGFVLTPFSPQTTRNAAGESVPAGAGNRCVMLEKGYLEFLTPTGDTPVGRQIRAAIARHTGLHLLAFGTPSAEEEHARLAQNGFAPLPLVNLQRSVDVSGESRLAKFSVVRVEPHTMPEGRVQFVQQLTPECLWQPQYLAHSNGVTGLLASVIVADDPVEVASRYARFSGLLPRRSQGFIRLATQRGDVLVGSATACKTLFGDAPPAAPAMAGYALACTDPAALRERLLACGCPVNALAPDLYATQLPAALGSAWLFGTEAAYQDWLLPGC